MSISLPYNNLEQARDVPVVDVVPQPAPCAQSVIAAKFNDHHDSHGPEREHVTSRKKGFHSSPTYSVRR
jgi:hypothetical protein